MISSNNNKRQIDINFSYYNYKVSIIDVIHKLNLKVDGNCFYFSNHHGIPLSINVNENYAIDNTYSKKYSVLELVSAEKDCTIYQAAMFLSVYYPEGIRSIKGTGCLDFLSNENFWEIYHLDKEEFLEKTKVSHAECEVTGAVSLNQVNFLLGALAGREQELRKEQEDFLKRFKMKHTIPMRNKNGRIEEVKANGFNESDYQYILDTFAQERKQVETMYQLFASCFRDLIERDEANNKNIFDEFDYAEH